MQNFEIIATNTQFDESCTVAIVKAKDVKTAIDKYCKARKKDNELSEAILITENIFWLRGNVNTEYHVCIFYGYNL